MDKNTGQTDSEFKAFLRFVLDAIREAEKETDEKIKAEKINKITDIVK